MFVWAREAMASDALSVIDLMVLYTPQARQEMGGPGGVGNQVGLALAELNMACQNSLVNARFRTVYCAEIPYGEADNLGVDLDRLGAPNDGYLDEVPSLRDRYHADLVCLMVGSGSYKGVAFPGPDEAHPFSVVRCMQATNFTFAHEIGHNLGCYHDRDNEYGSGAFPYSFGYSFSVAGVTYGTIMSYVGLRIPYFSNPEVLYLGIPIGIPEGMPNAADNAKTINHTAPLVASFRSPPLLDALPLSLSFIRPPGGGLQLWCYGPDGVNICLQTSTDLLDWSDLCSNDGRDPVFSYTETDTGKGVCHFYRALAMPLAP